MKISKRLGKLVAAVMAALIINIAVLSPALPVQASEAAEATTAVYPLIEAILEILGIASGLGASYEGMDGTSEMFADLQDQWTAGESLQYGGYDFTNRDDVLAYLDSVITTYNNHISGEEVNSYLMSLDAKSFAATGTLISKTNLAALETFKDYVLGITAEALEDEVEDVWRVIMNNGDSDGDGNSDDKLNFKITNMIMNALLAGAATDASRVRNEWLEPVSSTIYDWNEQNLIIFNYNGVNYPIYKVNTFEIYKNNSTESYFISTSRPVYSIFYNFKNAVYGCKFFSSSSFSYDVDLCESGFFLMKIVDDQVSSYNSSYGIHRVSCNYGNYSSFTHLNVESDDFDAIIFSFLNTYEDKPIYLDRNTGIKENISFAMNNLDSREMTADKAIDLAGQLSTQAESTSGTETATDDIAAVLNATAEALPEAGTVPDTDVQDYTGILGQILEQLLELPSAITGDLSDILEDIKAETASIGDTLNPPTEPNNGHSTDFITFLNGLIILVLILIELLRIFYHCLEFIMAIFKIQASTAFLPDEMVLGLDYIKTLEIPGIGMSVYDFMMGLVYIFIVFYAVRTLRMNIDRIRMPRR